MLVVVQYECKNDIVKFVKVSWPIELLYENAVQRSNIVIIKIS